jgi:hypothetical protein
LNVRLINVSIFDHFKATTSGIITGPRATMRDVNAAREVTDCTSPNPNTPSGSICFAAQTGNCCYGAAPGIGVNIQPTTNVVNDISVGVESQILRSWGRGATTSFLGGNQTRIDEATVWPCDRPTTRR